MDTKTGRYWMKQCVDSGLWVPSAESAGLFKDDYVEEEEDGEYFK